MTAELERCQYYLEKKSRTCRMLVKCGYKYCGEHGGEERNRIPCPLDPKHSVDRDDLASHLSKCNSRLNTHLPFVRPNLNGTVADASTNDAFTLTRLSADESDRIIRKLESIYANLDIHLDDAHLEHGSMKDELSSQTYGSNAKRHLRQQSSILEHADRLGLLDIGSVENVAYVEFGAGRARLSYWLAKAVDEKVDKTSSSQITYILIERSGQRYKFENKINADHPTSSSRQFQRIRCAIEHVDLRMVDSIRRSNSCVAFCKHLCGSGTDAALRCLVNANTESDGVQSIRIKSALLAPCCHHRCDWTTFTGRKTLSELGFTESEFKALTSMSSWATCGLVQDPTTKIDRKSIGKKCKLLLDYARIKYLQDTGLFKADMCFYAHEDVTPENVLIIVRSLNMD